MCVYIYTCITYIYIVIHHQWGRNKLDVMGAYDYILP